MANGIGQKIIPEIRWARAAGQQSFDRFASTRIAHVAVDPVDPVGALRLLS